MADPRRAKERAQELMDHYFEGVDSMRAYLDRNLHDSGRQRERLGHIAAELMRKPLAEDIRSWLVERLSVALGAESCTLWRFSPERGWRRSAGSAGSKDVAAKALGSLQGQREAVVLNGVLCVPLYGTARLLGALCICTPVPLVDPVVALLVALAGTVGMMLEQRVQLAWVERGELDTP